MVSEINIILAGSVEVKLIKALSFVLLIYYSCLPKERKRPIWTRSFAAFRAE